MRPRDSPRANASNEQAWIVRGPGFAGAAIVRDPGPGRCGGVRSAPIAHVTRRECRRHVARAISGFPARPLTTRPKIRFQGAGGVEVRSRMPTRPLPVAREHLATGPAVGQTGSHHNRIGAARPARARGTGADGPTLTIAPTSADRPAPWSRLSTF